MPGPEQSLSHQHQDLRDAFHAQIHEADPFVSAARMSTGDVEAQLAAIQSALSPATADLGANLCLRQPAYDTDATTLGSEAGAMEEDAPSNAGCAPSPARLHPASPKPPSPQPLAKPPPPHPHVPRPAGNKRQHSPAHSPLHTTVPVVQEAPLHGSLLLSSPPLLPPPHKQSRLALPLGGAGSLLHPSPPQPAPPLAPGAGGKLAGKPPRPPGAKAPGTNGSIIAVPRSTFAPKPTSSAVPAPAAEPLLDEGPPLPALVLPADKILLSQALMEYQTQAHMCETYMGGGTAAVRDELRIAMDLHQPGFHATCTESYEAHYLQGNFTDHHSYNLLQRTLSAYSPAPLNTPITAINACSGPEYLHYPVEQAVSAVYPGSTTTHVDIMGWRGCLLADVHSEEFVQVVGGPGSAHAFHLFNGLVTGGQLDVCARSISSLMAERGLVVVGGTHPRSRTFYLTVAQLLAQDHGFLIREVHGCPDPAPVPGWVGVPGGNVTAVVLQKLPATPEQQDEQGTHLSAIKAAIKAAGGMPTEFYPGARQGYCYYLNTSAAILQQIQGDASTRCASSYTLQKEREAMKAGAHLCAVRHDLSREVERERERLGLLPRDPGPVTVAEVVVAAKLGHNIPGVFTIHDPLPEGAVLYSGFTIRDPELRFREHLQGSGGGVNHPNEGVRKAFQLGAEVKARTWARIDFPPHWTESQCAVAAVLIEAEAIKGHALANRHRTPSLRGAANRGCLAAALRGVRFWGDAAKELTQELGREPTMEELLKRANFRHDSARAANRGNRLQTPELVQELTDKNNGVAPTPLELQQAANSKQSSIASANRGARLQTPELVQELTDQKNGVAPTPLELQQASNSKHSSLAGQTGGLAGAGVPRGSGSCTTKQQTYIKFKCLVCSTTDAFSKMYLGNRGRSQQVKCPKCKTLVTLGTSARASARELARTVDEKVYLAWQKAQ